MASIPRRNTDAPDEAARLLLRLGVFLLFVISLVAPIIVRQTVYVLPPIGAALLLAATLFMSDPRPATSLRASLLSPPLLAALLLVIWAGLSLLWTPFEGPASERFAKSVATLALVAIAVGFLPLRTKTSNLNLLPIGVALAALALTAITLLLAPKYTLEDMLDVGALGRAGLGLALLVWPAMGALALRGHWYVAGGLFVATAIACLLAHAPNAMQSLAIGAIVFAATFGRVREMSFALGASMAAIILFAPLAATAAHFLWPEHPPAFFRHLSFWGGMIAQDGARTLVGHGFGSATWGVLGGYLAAATPNSLIFKVWFDLGLLGAAALSLVGWRAALTVGATRARLAPFLLGGLAAGFAICVTGPAAEQLWWLTLAGLDAIAYALVMRGQFRKERPQAPPVDMTAIDAA